jgi:hypothetical protein
VSGRGRPAALPDGDHARPEYLVADGQGNLVVRHYNRDDKVREYDFAELPVAGPMQASLAAVFAARCTPGRLSTHVSSESYWVFLRQFAEFLARQQPPPRDLDELTPRMIRQWRAGLPPRSGYNNFRVLGGMLREDARLQAGPVADELARYYKRPRSRVQSYSETQLDRVTVVARRQFRAALRRISDNSIHLQRWRDGELAEGSTDWVIGEGLDSIARTGDLPRYRLNKNGGRTVQGRYRDAFRQAADSAPWLRLFLTREEAAALGVLLLAEYGWNLSVISQLEVPRASPDQGEDGHPTYRIVLVKPRRGPGRHYESRNVTDEGAASPGRLITQALEATRFARAIVEELAPGTNRLIVWRSANPRRRRESTESHPPVGRLFGFGVSRETANEWARSEGLDGSPFQRGRRTVLALDRREPGQHSQETHDRVYVLTDDRVRAGAVEVIAAGAEDAADRAHKAVLAAELRDRSVPGDIETATADCSSFYDSPWPAPDGGCGASFLICLACLNARIHPGHHPRLAHLHEALGSLRSVLSPAVWAAHWRDTYDRLEDLKQRLGERLWAQGLSRVTDADREIITHLLTGSLDS